MKNINLQKNKMYEISVVLGIRKWCGMYFLHPLCNENLNKNYKEGTARKMGVNFS